MQGVTGQRAGMVLLATVLLSVGVYDVMAALFLSSDATVSAIVLDLAKRYPILPLLVGIVLGHLFWPQ